MAVYAPPNPGYLFNKKKGPDPILVKDQLAMLKFFYDTYGIEKFAAFFFWILGKKEDRRAVAAVKSMLHARYVPFIFNPIQSDLIKKVQKRNITVKPRQVGMTTFFLIIRMLLEAIINPGTNSFLVSQNNVYASKHFVMLKRAFKYIGATNPGDKDSNSLMKALHDNLLHTTASNAREIVLDQLDNYIGVGSAEVEETGQGLTLHRVACSEVSRWPGKPEETLANLKEAIVLDGTLDLEATPNGAAGYFFEEFMRAEAGLSDFTSHFYEWWWDPTYRIELTDKEKKEMEADLASDERNLRDKVGLILEQVAFRRAKKLSLRHNFDEKYPEDPISCLDATACVVLPDGSTRRIDQIVKYEYKGDVLSVDSKGNIVRAKVINWYRNKRNGRKMYKLHYENAPNANKTKAGVILTEDHKVLTQDGWKRADECNDLKVATGTPAPGDRAFQILIGSLLGDAHIGKRDHTFSTGQTCGEYVKLKAGVLKNLGIFYDGNFQPDIPDGCTRKKVYKLNSLPLPYFRWLRKKWYPKGVKVFPISFVEKLDDFGLAIWFMDDGWGNLFKPSIYGGLATGIMDLYVVDEVADILTARGYECHRLDTNKKHTYIRFSNKGFTNLVKAIGKYVPPAMRYKLPDWAPDYEPEWFIEEDVKQFFDEAIVKKITPKKQWGKSKGTKNKRYEKGPVYCIDVEGTHNFVTLGGVVHNCFALSGTGFFDKDICLARYRELQKFIPYGQTAGYNPSKDIAAGNLEEGEDVSKRAITGCMIMKRWIPGRRYIIGADPASGKLIGSTDTDYSAAKVIDLDTGEHCASYLMRIPPIEFAIDLAALGRQYNNALIAVERGVAADSGGEGGTVITTLVHDCNYGNIYKHKEWLKRAKQTKQIIELEGMPMNGKTRPIALNRLKYFIENNPGLVWDISLIRQCMQFTRNELGRPEGAPGCHDDEVLAGAIAHYARMVSLGYLNPEVARAEKYGATPAEEQQPEEVEEEVYE